MKHICIEIRSIDRRGTECSNYLYHTVGAGCDFPDIDAVNDFVAGVINAERPALVRVTVLKERFRYYVMDERDRVHYKTDTIDNAIGYAVLHECFGAKHLKFKIVDRLTNKPVDVKRGR